MEELQKRIAQLEEANRNLRRKLAIPLPIPDDFEDEFKYKDAVAQTLTFANLTMDQMKHAFNELIDDEWDWVAESLFSTPEGDLWRIENGKLQIEMNKVRYVGTNWTEIHRVYNNDELTDIGRYFNSK